MASADTASRDATRPAGDAAKRHLWMHFTRMGALRRDHEVPIIVRGEGAYVYDEHGNRYLDGLSGALLRQRRPRARRDRRGDGRARSRELDFITIWSYAHPRAIELAERIACARARRPQPGLLHLRRLRGRRVGDQARPRLPPAHRQPAQDQVPRPRGRLPRHHAGRAAGDRHHRAAHATSSRSCRAGIKAPNTNSYHWPEDRDPLWAADQIEEAIEFEGPETVAAVILEPLQNAGGCIPPQDGYFQRVREICDRHNVLLVSDEVICAWGRLGHYFGCERYGYQPDIITTAKALTSAYAPMGAMIASDQRLRAVRAAGTESFTHGFTFAGHPVAAAAAMANLDIFEREDLCGHVLEQGGRVPRDARRPARHPDRRRRARRRLLPRDRAGQGPGDQGGLHRRGVRGAAARLPLRRALQAAA